MTIDIAIVDGPLGPVPATATRESHETGAAVMFEGIVRAQEDGRQLAALDYQAYRPMADRLLREIGERIAHKHGLDRLSVWHSRGRVSVGEVSFRLIVESSHRHESINAMNEFIDLLKRDVPIWKRPVWPER